MNPLLCRPWLIRQTNRTFTVSVLALLALAGTATCAPAQSDYTPYAFTNFAGMPGVSGSADGTGSAARFNWPDSVAVDGAGNVYVVDENNSAVRKVTPGGMVTTLAGLAGSPGSADGSGSAARFNRPLGVAVDSAGNVYVADCANDTIRKVTPAGVVTTLAGLAGAQGGADGTGSAARFYSPGGVAVDSTGNVYVADSYNHAIRKITPAGVVTTLAGLAAISGSADGLGSAARFYVPASVALDAAGNVYVADQFNQTIRKITPAGLVTTLAGQTMNAGSADGVGSAAQFYYPRGAAVDSAGDVYVGDEYNHTIRRITPAGAVTTLAGLAGNPGSADGLGSAARFDHPGELAVDGAGNLYVADIWNHRITKGTPFGLVQTACAPVPAGLVDWWAGEGNANDSAGANPGVLEGGVTFVPGEAGQAFSFNGVDADVKIRANPSLDVGLGAGFTVEAWIRPADLSQERPIVEWNSGQGSVPYGVHFWVSQPLPYGTGPGCLYADLIDAAGGYYYFSSETNLLTTKSFQHVALTYDKASGVAAIYLNGSIVALEYLGSFTPKTSSDLYLGYRPAGAPVGQRFVGQMDEVSLYDRALSAAEIQAIFAAGSYGKCPLPPVIAAPVIVDEPQNQTAAAGGTATFSVGANGSPPLSYQWERNGIYITGATGSSLALTDVQPAEAGVYSVIVSNAGGAVTSSSATLTVSAPAACAPVPAGLVSWWAGEGNANDRTGVNNGVPQGGVTFVPGEAGQAFSFDGATGEVRIPPSASLDVGTGDGLTIETWIKPSDLSQLRPLAEWNSGDTSIPYPYGVHFWISVPPPDGAGAGGLFGNLRDTLGASHEIASAAGLLTTAAFQHVALTYSKVNGLAVIYLNGAAVAQQNLGAFTPLTTSDFYLGYRPAGLSAGQRFVGQMDEVSLYNRALSATEVLSIYNAGKAGKCATPITQTPPAIVSQPSSQTAEVGAAVTFSVVAGGTPPLSYQWHVNKGTAVFFLIGATNASLTLTNVQLTDAGAYWVSVFNSFGTINSSNAALTVSAQSSYAAYAFTNLAGMPGISGSADGTGSAARFNGPPGVAVDTAGNIYVADSTNNTIRRVTSGGVVTTLAGLAGSPGSADGVGSAARFSAPTGVAVDGAGNLYVGDAANALIRKVTPAGVVTTLAGLAGTTGSTDGTGSAARFYQPAGVAVDSAGNVYVADYFNFTIRKVTPAGVVTTLAGQAGQAGSTDGPGSAARFYAPFAVAVDATDNVYVADQFNQTIRKITPTGVVTTMAGQPMQAGSADGIGSAARFNAPSGVAVDAAGNVYVGDQLNETIRKITPAGVVTTLAGLTGVSGSADGIGDEARFNKPCGVAVDNAGHLYVADAWNSRITKGTPSGLAQTACAPVPAGLVGWWAGEGNANDSIGASPGVLEGGVTFVPGEVGRAFSFDGATADVRIPAGASLNVGVGDGLTIETWIRPADLSEQRPLVEWNSGDLNNPYPYGVHFWTSVPPPWGPGAGCLFGNVWDTLGGAHIIVSAQGLLTTSAFQHAALTYSKTTGLAVIYLNGAVVAQQELGTFTPLTTSDLYLGYRSAGFPVGQRFAGQMDEVSLYRRALSAAEIQAIYAAGSSGKCALSPVIAVEPRSQSVLAGANPMFSVSTEGLPPTTFQWTFDGTNIAGATNATLILTNAQFEQGGTYSVAISNSAGYTLSAPATLTVLSPPQILSQPASAVGYFGASTTLQVQAEGTPPLSYQWYFDGLPISWGTNAFLSLSNLQFTEAGAYSVQITNLYGSVLSGSATLIINAAGVSPGLYAGLTISGAVGRTFGIQYATSLNATNTWTTITNLTLTQPVQLWVDTTINVSRGTPRFYRVIVVP